MYRRRAEEPMEMIHAEKLIYEYDKRDEDGNVVGTNRAIDGVDIPGLFREIFWPGFFIGFYYFLLVNGSNIASAILSTFMHLADQGSAVSGMSNLAYSPSGIMSIANEIWWEVLTTSAKGIAWSFIPTTDAGLFANLLGVFVSFGIWVLMAMVAIDVLILLIASWVLLYGGLVILAFGGGFGFGDDCCWIIILILLICCCCGGNRGGCC